jgi:anti-sigma factor RsiW
VDCKNTLLRLNAYLDGELPQAGAADVERHLRECPSCAAELAALRALAGALADLEGAAVPSRFAARVLDAARARDAARRAPALPFGLLRAGPVSRVLLRMAACLVAVAGLWMGMSVGSSASARGQQAPAESADVTGESEFDIQLASLSAAPPGSIAEAYLDFVSYEGAGGPEQ